MKKSTPLHTVCMACMACMVCILFAGSGAAPVWAAEASEPPEVVAQGAILMEAETGRVLWEKNARTPLAMASTTKIMTALTALRHGDRAQIITVSERAAKTPPVKMYLSAGENISLESLLYALMLQSSNDAAVAIAEGVGGSVEAFCQMMTKEAAALGAKDTVFETPNGLDYGDHHSTAYDMAQITRQALQNKDFAAIINTPSITVKSDRHTYDINNKNRLLTEFDGANGVKTGYTGKAGHCFVGAARRGDMQLISVVLASGWGGKGREQKWIDTKKVLNYGFDNYHYETLLEAGTIAGAVPVTRSKAEGLSVCFAESVALPIRSNEETLMRVEVSLPKTVAAPVAAGEQIGLARVYIDGALCGTIPLLTFGEAARFDMKTCAETVLTTFAQLATKKPATIVLPESSLWQ